MPDKDKIQDVREIFDLAESLPPEALAVVESFQNGLARGIKIGQALCEDKRAGDDKPA